MISVIWVYYLHTSRVKQKTSLAEHTTPENSADGFRVTINFFDNTADSEDNIKRRFTFILFENEKLSIVRSKLEKKRNEDPDDLHMGSNCYFLNKDRIRISKKEEAA